MSDEEVEPQTISALAGDVESSDDDEKVVTSPMPVLFLSHGAGPSILTTSELAPQLEGMDKVTAPTHAENHTLY